MKKIILALFLCTCVISSFSQPYPLVDADYDDRDTTELQTLPWFGNNQYLNNLLDSIGYPSQGSRVIGLDRVKYRIPIKFWIYRRSNGTDGPQMRDIQNYITNLNRIYNVENNTLIGFYMKCAVTVVNDDNLFEIDGDSEARNLLQARKEKGCINIHIVGDYEDLFGAHIRGRIFGIDGIILSFNINGTNVSTTIAHEVGHYLGLDHTHQYSTKGKCRKEAIDRNRIWSGVLVCPFSFGPLVSKKICESTGDLLSDTPADPDLNTNFTDPVGTCIFNQGGIFNNVKDPWNDSYVTPPSGSSQPQTRNVMSYNWDRECRTVFTRLQIAVMIYSIERGKNKNNKSGWTATRTMYDEYEMDDFAASPSTISLGVVQERNFHQQYNEDAASNPVWTNCDVDWILFSPTCSGTFDIETFYSGGATSPDTRLTLFAANGTTQLAQHDNISTTNKFSRITFSFVSNTDYLIRVENLNPVLNASNNSLYKISVGGVRIDGNDEFCGTSLFNLLAPTGTNVTWTITPNPNNIVNSFIDGTELTLSQKPIGSNPRIANSGNITITANYSQGCLGTGSTSKTVFVGTKTPYYGIYAPDGNCDGDMFEAIASSNNTGTVTYDWYVNGVLNTYHGYKLRSNFAGSSGTNIGVQVRKTGCGISQEFYQFWPCEVGLFKVSPNPSSASIKIETEESSFEKVRLVDKSGMVKNEWTFPKNSKVVIIDISRYPSDIYNIQIFDGKKWTGKMISKQ